MSAPGAVLTRHFVGLQASCVAWLPSPGGVGDDAAGPRPLALAGWSDDDGCHAATALLLPRRGPCSSPALGRWRLAAYAHALAPAPLPPTPAGGGGVPLLLASSCGALLALRVDFGRAGGAPDRRPQQPQQQEPSPATSAPLFSPRAPCTSLAPHPASPLLLAGGGDGGVALLSVGRPGASAAAAPTPATPLCALDRYLVPPTGGGCVSALAWCGSSGALVAGAAPGVGLHDTRRPASGGPVLALAGRPGERFASVACAGGAPHCVAAGGWFGGAVALWDTRGSTSPSASLQQAAAAAGGGGGLLPLRRWALDPPPAGAGAGAAALAAATACAQAVPWVGFDAAGAFAGGAAAGGPHPPLLAASASGAAAAIAPAARPRLLAPRERAGLAAAALHPALGDRFAAATRAEGLLHVAAPGAGGDDDGDDGGGDGWAEEREDEQGGAMELGEGV